MGSIKPEAEDFSCYITVQNNTDGDLLLSDFGIEGNYGEWPLYQPLNTIEKRSSGMIHLKDLPGKFGLHYIVGGSIADLNSGWRE